VRKLLQITILLILLTGCAGPVKQGWNNFTAYYNTFYNAKKYFSEGEELNLRQAGSINPGELVRVYKSPSDAGDEQFDEAIVRAASILRKHDDSKYVIPSLLMIGKSYFYKSEFFAALEKFREARALAQGFEAGEAVLWQARTLLELGDIDEGLRLIAQELDNAQEWPDDLLGRLYTINGQMLAESGNWEQASQSLLLAEEFLDDSDLKARTYFLHGQVLEQTQNLFQARAAYEYASLIKTDYDIEFHSRKKQADIARLTGDYDSALLMYRRLERDDKFLDYRIDMHYEAARTHQEMGNPERAIELYNSILHNRFDLPENLIRAKAYFGLGEIYRDDLDNFPVAAAYFDSSASQNVPANLISNRFDASELAASFGEYSRLKNSISERDSLLRLATLEPEQLDSVLAAIRLEHAAEMQQMEEDAARANIMLVTGSGTNEIIEATETAEYGFLNHMNRTSLTEASVRFQAVWGDRPLADNWRRRAAVSGSRFDAALTQGSGSQDAIQNDDSGLLTDYRPDLTSIPFEEEQKTQIRREIENFKYRLANLFLLQLDMPDSARIYYEEILQSGLNESLVPRALYSLIDLDLASGNEAGARHLANRLVENYPASPFTKQVIERLNDDDLMPVSFVLAENDQGIAPSYLAIRQSDTTSTALERAERLLNLATESRNPAQSEMLYYEAARSYLEAAIDESEDADSLYKWISDKQRIEQRQRELTIARDSAAIMLQDTTLSDSEREKWEEIDGSGFTGSTDLSYPFEGSYWDSTRSMLNRAISFNRSGRIHSAARSLFELLEKTEPAQADTTRSMEFPRDRFPTEPGPDMNRCIDAGLEPDVEGGIPGFMSRVQFPDWAYGSGLKTDIIYLVTVTPEGEIRQFEQVTNIDRSGIPQAVEEAIDREFRFKPLQGTDTYRCEITFPIDL
jgi:tetratricopeptide (TPR) repeat protein